MFTEHLRQAEINDGQRWGRAYINKTLESRRTRYVGFINQKVAFLEQQWNQSICTLAEAVEEKDAARIISDSLYVACIYDRHAYVTDNQGHWTAIVLDDLGDSIAQDCIISGGLQGYMATTSTNPTFLLDEKVDSVLYGQPAVIDTLLLDHPINLRGNTVVTIDGYYLNHALWLNGDIVTNPLHLNLVEQPSDSCFTDGGYYQVIGVLRLKEPRLADEEMTEDNDNYELMVVDIVKHHDFLRGDLNGDGNVDVSDVSILIDVVLGKEVVLAEGAISDLNNDGNNDVTDVSILIDIILGL